MQSSVKKDADDFNDLRQDTFVNLWRGLQQFRGDSQLSTWIYRVCLNTCVSTVRRRKGKSSLDPLDALNDIPEPSLESERDNSAMLHQFIAMLAPLDKAVIMMWLDERPYEEIAEVTGLKRNTVASRIRRIKEKLASMARSEGYNR